MLSIAEARDLRAAIHNSMDEGLISAKLAAALIATIDREAPNNYKRMLDLVAKAKHTISDLCSLSDLDAVDTALEETAQHIIKLREDVRKKKAEKEKLFQGGPEDKRSTESK